MDSLDLIFTPSAFKHGISEDSIVDVLTYPAITKKDPNRPVVLAIGFDRLGNTIEVAYDIERRVVFHAMIADKSKKGE